MLRWAVCVAWVLWISAEVIAIAFLLITKKQSHCESELRSLCLRYLRSLAFAQLARHLIFNLLKIATLNILLNVVLLMCFVVGFARFNLHWALSNRLSLGSRRCFRWVRYYGTLAQPFRLRAVSLSPFMCGWIETQRYLQPKCRPQ